ncbi:hypothetical protein VTI74DRAFT_1949 [Chaetomium olivicolor]
MVASNITQLLATYINALHILHYHRVLDGYGHLSVRNPKNPPTFFMMHQMAPALVSGLDDIGEYRVSDAEPVHPGTPSAPIERFIHSEILKRYPDVNVVLHGHPEELVSYSISNVPLRAAIHMAPFLSECRLFVGNLGAHANIYIGREVPNFDITKYYLPNDMQDFLVRNQHLGAALSAEFDDPSSYASGNGTQVTYNGDGADHSSEDDHDDNKRYGSRDGGYSSYPRHNLVLMRSHGFTAVATDIKVITFEGIYAVTNAKIESKALLIQHAFKGNAAQGANGIAYLTQRQIQNSWETEIQTVEKPWALWVREVHVDPLYVNELDQD